MPSINSSNTSNGSQGGMGRGIGNNNGNRSILRKFIKRIKKILTIKPFIVPISPRTRVNANSEDNCEKNLQNIKVTKLKTFLNKESLKISPLSDGHTISGIIDVMDNGNIPTKLKILFSKKVIGELVLMTGMNQNFSFDIRGKNDDHHQRYMLEIDEGDLLQEIVFGIDWKKNVIKTVSQYVIDQKEKYEIVDVYGQGIGKNDLVDNASSITDGVSLEIGTILPAPLPSTNNSQNEDIDEDIDCVVCLSNPRNTILIPCRHMCICSECTDGLINIDGKCPLCRSVYVGIIKIELQVKDQ